jgi:signal transduction histidine kinase
VQQLANGRWLSITETRTADGDIVAIRTDITELKRAEAELAREGERLRVALAAADIAVFGQDLDLRYTWAFNLRFGGETVDVVGKTDAALFGPETARAVTAIKRAVINHGRSLRREIDLLLPAGPVTWDLLVEPQLTNGRVTGIIGAAIDITARKAIEQQLRHSQRMDAIGNLTGGIAHDFNNMLSVMIGNLDMLVETLAPHDRNRHFATQSLAAAERGAELVRRLLAFSRRQQLQPTVFAVDAAIRNIAPLIQRAAGETVAIDMTLNPDVGAIEADQGQLENALINLTINARDAMPRGGRISITASAATVDEDNAPLYPDTKLGEYAAISLADNGDGIPPELLPRVFEPFFTTKPEGKGTGLGLSMVYGFCRQSGGTATIYSEYGNGTTVRLYFPRVAATAEATTTPSPALPPKGRETVLVVEDRSDVRAVAVGMLERLGYRTLQAEHAAAALELIERERGIDVVFTDIVMPGAMSGIELAQEIRRRGLALAVLLTSGYASPQALSDQARAAGLSVIATPYRIADLAEAIRAALDARRGAAA